MKHMVRERCQGVGESRKEPDTGGVGGGRERETYRQTDRQSESERERQTDRQTDRPTDRARVRERERESQSLGGMVIMNTRRQMLSRVSLNTLRV